MSTQHCPFYIILLVQKDEGCDESQFYIILACVHITILAVTVLLQLHSDIVFCFQGLPGTNGLPGGVGPQGPAVSVCLISPITLPAVLVQELYPLQ